MDSDCAYLLRWVVMHTQTFRGKKSSAFTPIAGRRAPTLVYTKNLDQLLLVDAVTLVINRPPKNTKSSW